MKTRARRIIYLRRTIVKIIDIEGDRVFIELPKGLRLWYPRLMLIHGGVKPSDLRVGAVIEGTPR